MHFEAAIEDKISLYENRLGQNNMYGFGVEPSVLYFKTYSHYRWYAGVNADSGASDTMELSPSALVLNAKMGIGSQSPQSDLEIVGPSDGARLLYVKESDTSPAGQVVRFHRHNNVSGGGSFSDALLTLTDHSTNVPLHIEDHLGGQVFTVLGSGNVGIGTLSPANKLEVNGTIRAKEVIVETSGWPDYVFEEDYELLPIADLARHVRSKKHLPGIESAADVKEKGQSIGANQRLMMQKIEELTLYIIELKEDNIRLGAELAELREEFQQ